MAYIQLGGDDLNAPCPLPKGVTASPGDRALVEKVSGKYMVVAVYG